MGRYDVCIIRADGQLSGTRPGRVARPLLIKKKQDQDTWKQASSMRSPIAPREGCDVGGNDVGIIRADGQLAGARRHPL